jgi:hypothetical protein
VEHQQALGDVYAAVGVDADEVVVEGGVVELASATMWAASSRWSWGRLLITQRCS